MAFNSKQTSKTRTLLGKQPARTLLVDTSNPLPSQVQLVDDLVNALENVFSVACSIGGPSRVPLFSVIALADYPETLLPLSHVKNNYDRLQASFCELKRSIQNGYQNVDKTCIAHGIQDACGQFKRQVQQGMQNCGICQQLEVIILTCRGSDIQKSIEEIASNMNMDSLKRIQIVSISGFENLFGDVELNNSQSSTSSNSSTGSPTCGLVDMITICPDLLSLHNFFNTWLLDTSTDYEHLHLVLPTMDESGDSELLIKCDIQERMFNPAQLPFYEQFTIHSDSATMKTFPSTSKALGMSIPIHRIKIVSQIPVSSICDSVVFGLPMIVEATRCWKIDWDDLEKNQHIFKALCHSLNEKGHAMIGYLETLTVTTNSRKSFPSTAANALQNKPKGHFVLMPSPNGTLLIKSLAVREMVLPYQSGSNLEGVSDDAISYVNESLETLDFTDMYNPFMWSSGLYESLKKKQKKNEPGRQKSRSNDFDQEPLKGQNVPRFRPINKDSIVHDVSGPEIASLSLNKKRTQRKNNSAENFDPMHLSLPKPMTAKRFKSRPILPFPTDL